MILDESVMHIRCVTNVFNFQQNKVRNYVDFIYHSSFTPILYPNYLWFEKTVERLVAKQPLEILEGNIMFDNFQTGFWKNQSTQTALLRVTNVILMSVDSGNLTILILLDWIF